jgi:hypothetical protein
VGELAGNAAQLAAQMAQRLALTDR